MSDELKEKLLDAIVLCRLAADFMEQDGRVVLPTKLRELANDLDKEFQ